MTTTTLVRQTRPKPTGRIPDRSIYERRESEVRSYARAMPRQFSRAEDVWMYDNQGGRYLDFLSGCSTLNYGHNHPALKKALVDYISADGIAHGLDLHTDAKAEFLETFEALILKPRGLDYRAMFTGPTGTNAVEAAIKLARKVTRREMVIAFTNGFHGMTLGALACTGNAAKRSGAGVPLNHVSHEPYEGYYGADVDTAALLDQRLSDPSSGLDAPAAILVETVQGEGGLNTASPEWLRAIADMDDPESLVVPILLDAILLVESYRGARHQITFLDDLSGSVDALLRELTIIEKSRLWAAE